jgi:hypothetical protein
MQAGDGGADQGQDDRQSAAEAGVGEAEEGVVDAIRDEVVAAAAHDRRHGEIGEREGEDDDGSGDQPRLDQRQDDVEEGARRRGAEARRGELDLLGDGGEGRCQHQHGKRQHVLDEAQHDARQRVEDGNRGQAECRERAVDEALLAEDDEPAIGADDLADEERQEEGDEQAASSARAGVS